MTTSNIILAAYSVFLLIILIINLLYFFQVFKYRLPGDLSLPLLTIHIILMLVIIVITDLALR